MHRVGLTGNIGSGKSLVAQIFETFGVPVFDADKEAKEILFSPEVSKKVIQLFGNSILSEGNIDRKKLAQLVFNDALSLQKLNSIIHPAVRTKFENWSKSITGKPYLIYEAAILFESGHFKHLDAVISVDADPEIRIQRVMDRDGVLREQVLDRMRNQWPDERKNYLADFVIKNNGDELLIEQIEKVHASLTSV